MTTEPSAHGNHPMSVTIHLLRKSYWIFNSICIALWVDPNPRPLTLLKVPSRSKRTLFRPALTISLQPLFPRRGERTIGTPNSVGKVIYRMWAQSHKAKVRTETNVTNNDIKHGRHLCGKPPCVSCEIPIIEPHDER